MHAYVGGCYDFVKRAKRRMIFCKNAFLNKQRLV